MRSPRVVSTARGAPYICTTVMLTCAPHAFPRATKGEGSEPFAKTILSRLYQPFQYSSNVLEHLGTCVPHCVCVVSDLSFLLNSILKLLRVLPSIAKVTIKATTKLCSKTAQEVKHVPTHFITAWPGKCHERKLFFVCPTRNKKTENLKPYQFEY